MKPYRGPPATLGSTAAAHLRLIVWCEDCRHQVEPDPAEMAERYGAETTVPDQAARVLSMRQPERPHGGERNQASLKFPRRRKFSKRSGEIRPTGGIARRQAAER